MQLIKVCLSNSHNGTARVGSSRSSFFGCYGCFIGWGGIWLIASFAATDALFWLRRLHPVQNESTPWFMHFWNDIPTADWDNASLNAQRWRRLEWMPAIPLNEGSNTFVFLYDCSFPLFRIWLLSPFSTTALAVTPVSNNPSVASSFVIFRCWSYSFCICSSIPHDFSHAHWENLQCLLDQSTWSLVLVPCRLQDHRCAAGA